MFLMLIFEDVYQSFFVVKVTILCKKILFCSYVFATSARRQSPPRVLLKMPKPQVLLKIRKPQVPQILKQLLLKVQEGQQSVDIIFAILTWISVSNLFLNSKFCQYFRLFIILNFFKLLETQQNGIGTNITAQSLIITISSVIIQNITIQL